MRDDKELLSKQLVREKMARKEAEYIAEIKSRNLYKINENLEALSNNLRSKERHTRAILQATADGILVVNSQFDVILCNEAACALFNYTEDELKKIKINELIDFPSETSNSFISFFSSQKHNVLIELMARPKHQALVPVEMAISSFDLTEEGHSLICVLRNITHRMETEQRRAMQHELVLIMAKHASLDEIALNILKIICEFMNFQEGALWKVDGINEVLRCVEAWSVNDPLIQEFAQVASKNITFRPGVGLPGRVWKSCELLWISDLAKDSNFSRAGAAEKAGLKSGFALPILFEGKILGIFEFFRNASLAPDQITLELINDIGNQLGIFIEKEQAQKKISTMSRLTGMSEVASSVLHNVGNSLNSINISIDLMKEKLRVSKMPKLELITEIYKQYSENKGGFDDEKSRDILQFLNLVAESWKNENLFMNHEIELLKKNVHHIKQIIETQQSFSHVIKTTEKISLVELLEHSLIIHELACRQAKISILRNFALVRVVNLDRVKLMQIILNLIKNGIDSLKEKADFPKELTLNLYELDDKYAVIEIKDNGKGILPSNLIKIFSNGYTTKASGHGMGLHTSALFAREIGGHLKAESRGIHQGAIFTLTIPFDNQGDMNGT